MYLQDLIHFNFTNGYRRPIMWQGLDAVEFKDKKDKFAFCHVQ